MNVISFLDENIKWRIEHIIREICGEELHSYYPQYYKNGIWNYIEYAERYKSFDKCFGPKDLYRTCELQRAYDFINFLRQTVAYEGIKGIVPVVQEDKKNWEAWCERERN